MFFKIGVLKNFCKFRKKTPVLEHLFNKVLGLRYLFYRAPSVAASIVFKDLHFELLLPTVFRMMKKSFLTLGF